MTASTDLDATLANIRARAEAATPGPWRVDEIARVWADRDPAGWDAFHIAACHDAVGRACDDDEANAEFIAHARADIELLLNLLDQVTTQRDEVQANRDALAHKVAEQRAVIAQFRALDRGHVDVRCTFPDDACRCAVPLFDLRAALDGADTTTTEPAECDHPGIEHGPFWATGICPKCRRCKFIGHGPLCVDCLTAATTTDGDAVHEGDTHA